MLLYIDYFNILRTNKNMRKVKSNKMKNKIKVHSKVEVAYTTKHLWKYFNHTRVLILFYI